MKNRMTFKQCAWCVVFCMLLAGLLGVVGNFKARGGRVVFNNECCGFLLLRPYYQSWMVYYSDGEQEQTNGKMQNLWCWPFFRHAALDMATQSAIDAATTTAILNPSYSFTNFTCTSNHVYNLYATNAGSANSHGGR
jgi:hypothetical protein